MKFFVLCSAVALVLLGIPTTRAAESAEGGQPACNSGVCTLPASPAAPAKSTVRKSGAWLIEETENFTICTLAGHKAPPQLATSLEQLRTKLCESWLPQAARAAWNPKCHIVVHPRLDGYLKEVGAGARQTTGSALVDFDKDSSGKDKISMRRIDLRGDKPDWFDEAVAHELTHVVLADRFVETPIPHWADEGMAIQADTVQKQRLHRQDFSTAASGGRDFRLAELLNLDGYPHPSRMGAFYGQSASVVAFLTKIGSKEQVVDFVARATVEGYDTALRNVYTIGGVGDLERRWRRYVATGDAGQVEISSHRPAAAANASQLAQSAEVSEQSGQLE